MPPTPQPSCPCASRTATGRSLTLKAVPATSLSVLIAFFPKCPVCWAAWMSLLGGLGLARLPYLGWLFPVLCGLLGLHLLALVRSARRTHCYRPLMLSLAGAIVVASARLLSITETWVLLSAMVLMASGSLLNAQAEHRRLSSQ